MGNVSQQGVVTDKHPYCALADRKDCPATRNKWRTAGFDTTSKSFTCFPTTIAITASYRHYEQPTTIYPAVVAILRAYQANPARMGVNKLFTNHRIAN